MNSFFPYLSNIYVEYVMRNATNYKNCDNLDSFTIGRNPEFRLAGYTVLSNITMGLDQ